MCRISRLPDNTVFEGYMLQEKYGFVFHTPTVYGIATLSQLHQMLSTSETHIAKALNRNASPLHYIKGNKVVLRNAVLAMNKKHELPGVGAQKQAA